MFERFNDRARRVVVYAQEHCRELGHDYIGTEHLLLGMFSEGGGIAAQALAAAGVDETAVRAIVVELAPPSGRPIGGHIPFVKGAKSTLERSLREALALGHDHIGTEHLLLALAKTDDPTDVVAQVFSRLGVDRDALDAAVLALVPSAAPTAADEASGIAARLRSVLRRGGSSGTDPDSDGPREGGEPRIGRVTPALAALFDRLRAGDQEVTGTHHLLAELLETPNAAANDILAAGGFDAATLPHPAVEWDVSDTDDELAANRILRSTSSSVDDDGVVVVRIDDGELSDRLRAQSRESDASFQAMLAKTISEWLDRKDADETAPESAEATASQRTESFGVDDAASEADARRQLESQGLPPDAIERVIERLAEIRGRATETLKGRRDETADQDDDDDDGPAGVPARV